MSQIITLLLNETQNNLCRNRTYDIRNNQFVIKLPTKLNGTEVAGYSKCTTAREA